MPPRTEKGRREAEEVAAFVRELYAQSGFNSWGEFARSAGVAAATISDWQRAENATSGYNLLKLIRASDWQPSAAEDPQLVRLESLEAGQQALTTELERGRLMFVETLEQVRDAILRLESRLPREDESGSAEAVDRR